MKRFFALALFAGLSLAAERVLAQQGEALQPVSANAAASDDGKANDPGYMRALTKEGMQPGDTHVRIVRLSDVAGKVYMDRNVGRGPEEVMRNMPVEQGMALATDGSGFAEVEFEDGSTLRLAPLSEVRFPLLVLRSSGKRSSMVLVDRGIVYVHTQRSKDAELSLAMGQARFRITPGSHLRLDMTGAKAELAAIDGSVSVQAEGGAAVAVQKAQTLSIDLDGKGATSVEKEIYENTYDEWDRKAMQYHDRYLNVSRNRGSMPLYGASDLNYYGSFVNGCGSSFWQPYFASAAWSPYSQGTWTLYSQGYSWVSPYPWGWLPFHTGAWSFCPGMGWGWRPGGAWYGVQNVSLLHGAVMPGAGSRSMVAFSNAPVVSSSANGANDFVFRRDSAGLGVPRGSLGGLQGFSRDALRNGSANVGIYSNTSGPQSMLVRGGGSPTQPGTPPVQRGPTPNGMPSGNDRFSWKNQPRPANPPPPVTQIPKR